MSQSTLHLTLPEELKQFAESRAQSTHKSPDEYLSDLIRADLARQRDRKARALSAIGKFASGQSDVSIRHDDYLAGDLPSR